MPVRPYPPPQAYFVPHKPGEHYVEAPADAARYGTGGVSPPPLSATPAAPPYQLSATPMPAAQHQPPAPPPPILHPLQQQPVEMAIGGGGGGQAPPSEMRYAEYGQNAPGMAPNQYLPYRETHEMPGRNTPALGQYRGA